MQVRNINGVVFHFNPHAVPAIIGPKSTDSDARFYIHGLASSPYSVSGDVEQFAATIPDVKFVKFTLAESGRIMMLNIAHVRALSEMPAKLRTKIPNGKALIRVGNNNRVVIEDVASVKTAINNAGGNI